MKSACLGKAREPLLEPWEEFRSIRALVWNRRIIDEKRFLIRWLSKVRKLFKVDFSSLFLSAEKNFNLFLPQDSSLAALFAKFAHSLLESSTNLKAPLVVEDINADDRFRKQDWGFRSLLGIPFPSSGSEPSGVLLLGSFHPRLFTPIELFHLQWLADELAWAIKESETQRRYQELLHRQQTLHGFLVDISVLELNQLLKKMAEAVVGYFHGDFSTVRLLDGRDHFRLIAMSPEVDTIAQDLLATPGTHITPKLLQGQNYIAVPDLLKSPEFSSSRQAGYGVRAYLGVPLLSPQGKITGVLDVCSFSPRDFSGEEISFIEQIARQATIAIENARLFESVREKSSEMERLNKQLVEADRVKTEFLANVSHELRTPLNVILGYSGVLYDMPQGAIEEDQRQQIHKIETSAKELLELIRGLLDLTTIQEGKLVAAQERVHLSGLIEEALAPLREKAQSKGLEIQVELAEGLPEEIVTDPLKLRQIIRNLVDNAIKFTHKGGVRIEARLAESMLCIRVEDTGMGMEEKDLEIIFERFRQLDGSQTRHYGGLGIGLNLVKEFVKLLQGHVQVTSKPEKGSAFTVLLPYQEASSQPSP